MLGVFSLFQASLKKEHISLPPGITKTSEVLSPRPPTDLTKSAPSQPSVSWAEEDWQSPPRSCRRHRVLLGSGFLTSHLPTPFDSPPSNCERSRRSCWSSYHGLHLLLEQSDLSSPSRGRLLSGQPQPLAARSPQLSSRRLCGLPCKQLKTAIGRVRTRTLLIFNPVSPKPFCSPSISE